MVGLGDLPGGAFSSAANAVSADGSVIVGSSESASGTSTGTQAFRWTSDGGMVGLGDLPGGVFLSAAFGVSADGSVAVGQGTSASGTEAFIWDAPNGIRRIRDVLLPEVGAALDGWNLQVARGISADGRTVVGVGTNPNGDGEGWLAYLPDEIYWFAEASGIWDSALNWSGPFVPGPADDVVIDSTAAVTVTGPAAHTTVNSLSIGGSGTGRVTLLLGGGAADDLVSIKSNLEVNMEKKAELALVGGLLSAPQLSNAGLIRGTGTLDTNLINEMGGEVRIAAGQSLVVSGSAHSNAGKIETIDGSLEVIGVLANEANTGLITGENATLRFIDGLTNDNTVALSFGTSRVFGDVTNSASGSIAVAGNSNVTFYDDVTNGGTLNVAGGSTAVFFGELSGNGNVGTGDVQALGDLVPGASPGLMEFGGNLTLGPLSNLQIELGGLVPGSEFDQLAVAGDVALAGALGVSLINGFNLSAGDSFEIFDIDGVRTGTFTGLAEGALVDTLSGVDLFVSYVGGDGNDVTLFTVAPILIGDYNGNGVVNAADYVVWRANEGTNNMLPNDPIGGTIGHAHYDTWRANFGSSAGGGSATSAAVPEPATWVLLLLGGAVAGRWRGARLAWWRIT
jgi:probable HAF family extracellular repeat protein